MTGNKAYHIILVPEKGSWKVLKAGASRATKVFKQKSDAINFADAISKKEKTALYIHTIEGTVEEKRSYNEEAVVL